MTKGMTRRQMMEMAEGILAEVGTFEALDVCEGKDPRDMDPDEAEIMGEPETMQEAA